MATRKSSGKPKFKTSHERALRGRDEGGGSRRAAPKPSGGRGGAAKGGAAKGGAAKGAKRGIRPSPTRAGLAKGPSQKNRKPRPATPAVEPSAKARELAILVATAGIEKKAEALKVLDVAGKVDYADFLVLMSGRSDRQVQALAYGIDEALRKVGKKPRSIEGLPKASWVIIDCGDVVVHVLQDEARAMYDLDDLFADARELPVSER